MDILGFTINKILSQIVLNQNFSNYKTNKTSNLSRYIKFLAINT